MTNETSTAVTPKSVRAKMTAVLSARSRMKEAEATKASAFREYDRHKELAFTAKSPPATTEVVEVQAFLTDLEAHHLRYQSSIRPLQQEEIRWAEAQAAWHNATHELAKVVAAAQEISELESDRVVVAATRMAGLAKPPQKVVQVPDALPDEPEEPEFSTELTELEEALRQAVLDLSVTCARALSLAPRLTRAKKALGSFKSPEIQFPVRPTEEEVQRFLQQTEQFMVARLEAHRLVLNLLARRKEFVELIDEQQLDLEAKLAAYVKLLSPESGSDEEPGDGEVIHYFPGFTTGDSEPEEEPERRSNNETPTFDVNTEALLAFCQQVHLHFAENAKAALGDEYDTSNLDSVNIPKAGVSDRGKIDEIRKLMHTYAVACGHHKESLSAKEAAELVPEQKVELKGVDETKSWEECLDLFEQHQLRKADAKQHNESRDERISLLKEALEEYDSQRKRAARILHRFVITIIPSADQPDAPDELRILTNAAAWMANPEGKVSEGGYPVY